ncbi:hypothetical protein [Mycobacterium camsae]|uniref:hypothetical protein n=1 Tax=Mycobacterium gordonae TaxID=1778 RepID=UPI00197FA3E0|nr:hypothetical protein [Mycobacterium gordonae]
MNLRESMPALLSMYREGKLDELVTRRYRLEQINEAVDDMRAIASTLCGQHQCCVLAQIMCQLPASMAATFAAPSDPHNG